MSNETGRVSGWRAAGTGERESLRPRGHDAPEVVA
jgi:hypothetical protein